jgi:hypothetical protein
MAVFVAEDGLCSTTRTYSFGISALNVNVVDFKNISQCGDIQSYDGYAQVEVTGGLPPYSFISWSGPNGFTGIGYRILNISNSGLYTAQVVDINGCSVNTTVFICCCEEVYEPPQGPAFYEPGDCFPDNNTEIEVVPVVTGSNDGNNGSIELNVSGGSGNYIFNWDNGQETQNLSNLLNGRYCVTVSDGCSTYSHCFSVGDCLNEPFAIQGIIDDACTSWGDKGSIVLNVSNNSTPFTFNWSHDETLNSSSIDNLSPGEYCVTVGNSVGCSVSDCYYIDDISNSNPPIIDDQFIMARDGECALIVDVDGEEDYFFNVSFWGKIPRL